MVSPTLKRILPYGVALASVGTVALVLNTFPWLLERGAFAMLLGCVFISTWFGGWRTGLLAILLAVFLTAYLVSPSDSLRMERTEDWVRLGIFCTVALMIAGLHASRSRAMDASRLSSERLKAALDAARMGAWDRNLQTGEFWWSPGVELIFGRKPGTYVPSYDEFLGYLHPDDRQFVSNAFTRSVEHGTEFEIEHRIVRPDHGVRWIITRGKILFDRNGVAERLLAVAVDVTDRHAGDAAVEPAPEETMTALRGRM